ncbi:hypothetical protein C6P42_003513 [Pichia californica]|nr:hypothetical protein C6P42_003513 [[Candida] californica]
MLSISKSELENSKEGTQLYDNYIEYKKILDSFTLNQVFHPQAQTLSIEVVKNCENCDLVTKFSKLPALMQQVKTPLFGEVWHIDFVGPLTTADAIGKSGCKFMLVAVEYVSGYCVASAEKAQN